MNSQRWSTEYNNFIIRKICIYCFHESLDHTEDSRIWRCTVQRAGYMTKLENTSLPTVANCRDEY